MHDEGHIMYFQGFELFIITSGVLYFAKTILTWKFLNSSSACAKAFL